MTIYLWSEELTQLLTPPTNTGTKTAEAQRKEYLWYVTFNQQGLQVWGEGWVAMKAFQEDIFGPGLALRLLARDKG